MYGVQRSARDRRRVGIGRGTSSSAPQIGIGRSPLAHGRPRWLAHGRSLLACPRTFETGRRGGSSGAVAVTSCRVAVTQGRGSSRRRWARGGCRQPYRVIASPEAPTSRMHASVAGGGRDGGPWLE